MNMKIQTIELTKSLGLQEIDKIIILIICKNDFMNRKVEDLIVAEKV